jgi:hypothetical protein
VRSSSGKGGGGKAGRKLPPAYLRDMRRVYQTGGKDGSDAGLTDAQAALWKLFRTDPDKFVSKYLAAEKEFAAGADKAKAAERKDAPAAAVELDDGTKKVLPLLDAQLAKFKNTPGKPCRTCGQTVPAGPP